MLDMNYFRKVQGACNTIDEGDYKSVEAKENLLLQFRTSINYKSNTKRNDVVQPFIITASEVKYKYNITAMPGDELYPGDIVYVDGEHILVQQTRVINETYVLGLGWLCNLKLRFQNFDSTIHERYCVLDSGVYSTTVGQEDVLAYLKRQYNLWISSDEDTDKIYIDKRLAIDKMYDQHGNIILDAYKVTGRSKLGKGAYGDGTHLLNISLKSSEEISGKDNIEEMICDYISPIDSDDDNDNVGDELLTCEITGRNNIRLGSSRTYSPVFYNASGVIVDDITPSWEVECPTGITYTYDGNNIKIHASDSDSLSGESIELYLSDANGLYMKAHFTLGVF